MYWIYLTIFVLAVLVPDMIGHEKSVFFLREEQLEEILIFLLGMGGFLIFRWKEKQSNIHLDEKIKIQKEAHQISKNLTSSYSYIGENNRKLDIMKNISFNLLEMDNQKNGQEKRFFDSVMEAIFILGKSKKFIIRFINTETQKTLRELKSRKKMFLKVNNEDIINNLKKGRIFAESNYHFIITSPRKINNVVSAIIISKNNQQQKLEDPDILKALASQSLFIFCNLKNI